MEKIQIAICATHSATAKAIAEKCQTFFSQQTQASSWEVFQSAEELLASSESFQLLFFDLEQSAEGQGELIQELKERFSAPLLLLTPHLELTTAEDRSNGLFYLKKPIEDEAFQEVLLAAWEQSAQQRILPFQCAKERRLLWQEEILYLEALKTGVAVHTQTGIYLANESLPELYQRLDTSAFVYCNRNDILNLRFIDCLEEKQAVLTNGQQIAIAGKRDSHLHEQYQQYPKV